MAEKQASVHQKMQEKRQLSDTFPPMDGTLDGTMYGRHVENLSRHQRLFPK